MKATRATMTPYHPGVEPGDLVMKICAGSIGLFIGWYKQGTNSELAEVMWQETNRIDQIAARYLEVIHESR